MIVVRVREQDRRHLPATLCCGTEQSVDLERRVDEGGLPEGRAPDDLTEVLQEPDFELHDLESARHRPGW